MCREAIRDNPRFPSTARRNAEGSHRFRAEGNMVGDAGGRGDAGTRHLPGKCLQASVALSCIYVNGYSFILPSYDWYNTLYIAEIVYINVNGISYEEITRHV